MRTSLAKTAATLLVTGALVLTGCGSDDQTLDSDNTDEVTQPTGKAPPSDGSTEPGDNGGDDSVPGDPDDVVSSPPLDPADPGDPGDPGEVTWQRINHTEDLKDPMASTPEELVVNPDDDRVVLVRFWGGVPECFAARATVVEETAERVEILLETGSNPEMAPDTACIALAAAQELAVTLDAPVGDRELVATTAS